MMKENSGRKVAGRGRDSFWRLDPAVNPNFDRKIGVSLFPTKTWVVFSAENVPMYVKDISIALT